MATTYTLTASERKRLNELQKKENTDSLTKAENTEYESLVTKYRKTKDYKGKMAKGGFVGKGEMVWKNLSSSDKIDFLRKNFTPEITPRSQQTLVGKDYNFLPKNVKIKIESMYANVDSSENKGSTDPETQKKIKGLEAVIANKNIDQKFRDKAKVELDRIMADVEKVEAKVEKAVDKVAKPTTKPQRKAAPKKKPMPKAPEKKIKDIDLEVAKSVEPKGGAARRAKVVSKPKAKVEPEKTKETPKRTKKTITSTKRKKAAATETPKRKKKVITSAKRKKASMVDVPTSKRGLAADKKREALPVGKRTSAAGNTYYEYRRNRADRKAKRKFKDGGNI